MRLSFILSLLSLSAVAAPRLTIVLPYAGAGRLTAYWSTNEEQVDWRRAGIAADRCTSAFAAMELKEHLAAMLPGWEFRFVETMPAEGPAIVVGPAPAVRRVLGVRVDGALGDSQSYVVRSLGRGRLLLAGGGREGTLYAVYDYLTKLGWRWYAPGKRGTVEAAKLTEPKLEGWDVATTPDFPIFRGFLAAAESLESNEMLLWMARNRTNSWAYRPRTYALMRKLGIRFVTGGHILEDILNPDTPQPDGRTLFEAHRDWFPEVGGKRLRENAARYQFCVSNDQAVDYVARSVVKHFGTDWKWTDFQNAWMLDTWAGWCQCTRCRALGNDADRYLHFLSRVRAAVTAAEKAGQLARSPGMLLCAYEGTPSLEGPERAVPENLSNGKDLSLYAPINRCYAHTLEDPRCTELNAHYARALEGWGKVSGKFPLAIVEYYNNSKVEDLPVLFTRTMGPDFAYFKRNGVKAMTYMQAPVTLQGPRALTQVLFARLAWDTKASVSEIKQEYFRLYYGAAESPMRDFYEHLETAYTNLSAWRSWHRSSVIWKMLHWEKSPPERPLFSLRHLQPEGGDVIGPRESIEELDKAGAALKAALGTRTSSEVRFRMEEDARLFRYADDSFRFYWAMCGIYQAEQGNDAAAARDAWREAKRYADSLVGYYIPFWFAYPGMGVSSKDGLERTQLRPLFDRLREKYDLLP